MSAFRSVRRSLLAGAALAMVVVTLAVPTGVLAATVLDQSQTIVTGTLTLPSTYTFAGQTFTAGATGSLVRVSLYPESSLNGYTVEIRTTAAGLPTATVIGSGTVGSGTINTFVNVDLDVPAFVTSGVVYAIVVGPLAGTNIFAGVAPPGAYAGGTAVGFVAGAWTDVMGDLAFRTYVDVEPDLTITSSHSGNFRVGQTGTYTLHVSNVGGGSTNGTVTVVDTLPAGLPPTSVSGSGWTCSIRVVLVTCTRSNSLAAGDSYPDITLSVRPSVSGLGTFVNMARVSGDNDTNPANNLSLDRTITGF